MLNSLVLDGSITWIALGVLAIELAMLRLLLTAAIPGLALLLNAFSGMFLILALRAALLGSGAPLISLWLMLGFLAHLGDIALRCRVASLKNHSDPE